MKMSLFPDADQGVSTELPRRENAFPESSTADWWGSWRAKSFHLTLIACTFQSGKNNNFILMI